MVFDFFNKLIDIFILSRVFFQSERSKIIGQFWVESLDLIWPSMNLKSRSFETSHPTTLTPLFLSFVGFSPLGLIEVAMTSQPLFFKSCARMNPNPESQPYIGFSQKVNKIINNNSSTIWPVRRTLACDKDRFTVQRYPVLPQN